MSIDTVIGLYEGFHFEGELRMLNRLAAGVEDGYIVAIGSYRGQSDCALALHAQVPVYAIDDRTPGRDDDFPFGQEDRVFWMRNLLALGVAAKVRPINLPSETVAAQWDLPIGLLFIDGSHDFDSVSADLRGFLPWVVEGGLVAFHDNNKPGVMRAIETVWDRLEEVETADITSVYRVVVPMEKEYATLSKVAAGAGNTPDVPHRSMDADVAAALATVKAKPHASQRPKTAAKKKTTGRGK